MKSQKAPSKEHWGPKGGVLVQCRYWTPLPCPAEGPSALSIPHDWPHSAGGILEAGPGNSMTHLGTFPTSLRKLLSEGRQWAAEPNCPHVLTSFLAFTSYSLTKDHRKRPKYNKLLVSIAGLSLHLGCPYPEFCPEGPSL